MRACQTHRDAARCGRPLLVALDMVCRSQIYVIFRMSSAITAQLSRLPRATEMKEMKSNRAPSAAPWPVSLLVLLAIGGMALLNRVLEVLLVHLSGASGSSDSAADKTPLPPPLPSQANVPAADSLSWFAICALAAASFGAVRAMFAVLDWIDARSDAASAPATIVSGRPQICHSLIAILSGCSCC